MARYIDVDLLIKNIAGIEDLRTLSTKTVGKVIKNTPTADVEEVVRCKDCKHYTDNMNEDNLRKGFCGKTISCFEFRKSTDFCSYGERK